MDPSILDRPNSSLRFIKAIEFENICAAFLFGEACSTVRRSADLAKVCIMRVSERHRIARATVAILYGLAMLLLPLAHRSGGASLPEELSAYALPDGTLPVICTTGKDPTEAPRGHATICDACVLFCAPGLLVSATSAIGLPFILPVRLGRQSELAFGDRLYLTFAAQPRAPPTISA